MHLFRKQVLLCWLVHRPGDRAWALVEHTSSTADDLNNDQQQHISIPQNVGGCLVLQTKAAHYSRPLPGEDLCQIFGSQDVARRLLLEK